MDTVRRYAMLIDGDWVDTEDRFEIRSPATEELVASVAKGGREHADQAVAAAKAAHTRARNTCATCTTCPNSTGWRSSTSS